MSQSALFDLVLVLPKVSSDSALFRHYGVSPWEIEVIFDTLRRSFEVEEEQLRPNDPRFVSVIEVSFPVPYNEDFFQKFSMESWFKIKGVLKDVKRRRGKKGFRTCLQFFGIAEKTKLSILFPLSAKNDRPFEMGIEKIEYLVDIVPVQLKELPVGVSEVWYTFDEESFKWQPDFARVADGSKYILKGDIWKQT